MMKKLFAYLQYILPQHLLTLLVGYLADTKTVWLKNWLIQRFIKLYHVNLEAALQTQPAAYACFNDFFIRQLKPGTRHIAAGTTDIACPADGTIAQCGTIQQNQLLQAKNMYYSLESLLGGDTQLAKQFHDGDYVTIYLAPSDYHRFHMPITGKLKKTIYVPGRLFSVNQLTSSIIPNLYGRNERLITAFDTAVGPMAVVLVGALIVGSIKTVWQEQPLRSHNLLAESFTNGIEIAKGGELGYFKMGSTVIVIFPKNKANFAHTIQVNRAVEFGERLGTIQENS